MDRTMTRMGQIQDSVEEAAARMVQLTQGAQRIAQAASLVRALAERTNLVALNASVSAARTAGESREFGVVAKEIRSLSQQSEQIAREIDRLVGNIQQYTQQVTVALQNGKTEANNGVKLLGNNQADLRQITTVTEEIVVFTREIARLTQSQVSTAAFLSQAIAQLKHR
jgi:methyl-accepting chemotaxis protein